MAAQRSISRSGKGLMVLETPLLKVSRPVAACSRCRAAKIKCDGKLPACSACEKTGKSAECASANDNFARGKERSYVSTLETRIEKLERRLREVRQRKSSVISMSELDTEQARSGAQALREMNPHKNQRAAKRKEARDIDELVSDFGYLTVNASARDYHGFTSFMSYARLVLSACSKDRLPVGMRVPYPPRQMATATIQHYLDNLYTLLPFFEETGLYYSIDNVYRSMQDHNAHVSDYDQWCVRMVLAITNAFLSEQRGDQYYLEGVGHVSAALDHAEAVLKPGTIQSVQALLFLVEYALLDPSHFDAWSLIGAASRAMVDLGLHQDPPKGSIPSRSRLELRRRVFHCVYMLDRSSAIVQTRAFAFSDDSTNVMNPFTKSQQAPQTTSTTQRWLKTFDHAVDLMALRQMQSKWYYEMFQSGREQWTDPYPYIWQTYHSMTSWFSSISPATTEPIRAFFELELLYSYIYILGASPRVHKPAPYSQTLLFEHCISYAGLLTRLNNDPKHLAPVTFDDNMRAYMTGMQLLDVLVKHRDQLISGVAPEPPHLPPGAPPAPALPPLQTEPNVNLLRAINAINQISEALKVFGQRWGFMSWRDNFERAVEPMLKALDSRLWELQQTGMDSHRRPSHMLHGSSGSVATMDTVSRHSSQASQASQHPSYTASMTGPQLRAMRSSQASMYAPLPYGMHDSPPYSSVPMGPPMGNSPPTQSSPPTNHPPYVPPPPSNFDDPSRQFSSWTGLSSADGRHGSMQIGSPRGMPPQ
ncbi:hypothetical protein B9Z65_2426 [Elsinoe australis]|uniref:Zn(2)-C6 fungal-type domain-containing protein n=1 Tax=Elsinoe australis TaxID=40998 RepID=A0A2P7ZAN7_9PEZI|nr:hypothetical protein B9Z65_2426 [Elsinoe australis]